MSLNKSQIIQTFGATPFQTQLQPLQFQTKINYENDCFEKQDKGISKKSKIAIILGSLAAAGLAAFIFLRKGRGINSVRNAADSLKKDVLSYNIKPPKISDIPADPEVVRLNADFPLEVEYAKIMADINRDPGTLQRYNEVISGLQDTATRIGNKIHEICPNERFGADEHMLNRVIRQKRYFSLPGNVQNGYCGKDPLLYRAAREEGIDIILGYSLLAPLQNGGKESGAPGQTWMEQHYGHS